MDFSCATACVFCFILIVDIDLLIASRLMVSVRVVVPVEAVRTESGTFALGMLWRLGQGEGAVVSSDKSFFTRGGQLWPAKSQPSPP